MSPVTLGIFFGLATAICWCFSSLAFEAAGKRAGSIPVNLIRLVLAFIFLTIATTITRGLPFPTDATAHQWTWLLASGVVGFFIGDITLFRAFVLIGARMCALITCTAPIFALIAESIFLRKFQFSMLPILGILVTLVGVAWVISERRPMESVARAEDPQVPPPLSPQLSDSRQGGRFSPRTVGIVLAFLGAAGQGIGAVLTSRAFEPGNYNALATGQIRMLAGMPLFFAFVLLTGRVKDTLEALRNPPAMAFIALGAFGGPFLGVTFFTTSLQYVPPSVTQTLVSLVPILMIPVVVLSGKEKVSLRAILGTLTAVAGVFLLIHFMPS